ncbi:MAG: L-glutamine kinase [Chlamydiales bacterium]|nr:L-glutamine kinase [Chlamydiales bacterium]MCH9634987.1 L-glutamine kinase [Chlamydiales bacterium]
MDSTKTVKPISFESKAKTLATVASRIQTARVLPQLRFSLKELEKVQPIELIEKKGWLDQPLVIRSSAVIEDSESESMAGHFVSVLNVVGFNAVKSGLKQVANSLADPTDEIFVQPMLTNVKICGVAFSRTPNTGAPYIQINYDDSGSTTSVTDGSTNQLLSYLYYRKAQAAPPDPLDRVVKLLFELEELFSNDSIDIEFAINDEDQLYLFQVRPLLVKSKPMEQLPLDSISKRIEKLSMPHPNLHGSRSFFGIMPDWNPAEIIGLRPNTLSLSLYKELITDQIWAYQRNNYGYLNLRSFPLLIDLCGLPYIDVRVSFNSFIPQSLCPKMAKKLVEHYLDRLEKNPHLHDKIEFEVVFSCYTVDLPQRVAERGFSKDEVEQITQSLRELTNGIIDGETGLWRQDIEKIEKLEEQYQAIVDSPLDRLSKIYWLMENCKRYGTLPFAGLARAGFIAVELLKSLVREGVLSEDDYQNFLASLDTVSGQMVNDLATTDRASFLDRYGHLRPGTYDILSPTYAETPDLYFDWKHKHPPREHQEFHLSLRQLEEIESLLKSHGITHNVLTFFSFLKTAIEGREHSKFVFTKTLSKTLSYIEELGEEHGFAKEQLQHMDVGVIKQLYSSSTDIAETMGASIDEGCKKAHLMKLIQLPPLITKTKQLYGFFLPTDEPNFITLKRGRGVVKGAESKEIEGAVVCIPSADPGYDWIFSHKIAALITMYGGMNSHMAIRAAELSIPAVIGAGETLYERWSSAKELEVDCLNRRVVKLC